MARIRFTVDAQVPLDAAETYRLLCDWEDHARWVPFTRVTVHEPDRFTAWTGVWKLQLEDNMTVAERDDEARRVLVDKTGPVLIGTAEFTVTPQGSTRSRVHWVEDVEMARLPRLLAPLAALSGRVGFRLALRRLAR
jgi:carbon monoxide dehydrogenase subunit G